MKKKRKRERAPKAPEAAAPAATPQEDDEDDFVVAAVGPHLVVGHGRPRPRRHAVHGGAAGRRCGRHHAPDDAPRRRGS